MSESTAVVKVEEKKSSLGQAMKFEELPLENAAKLLMASGVVKQGESPANVVARLSLGRSLGLADLQSLGGIMLTEKGQIMMSAALMKSLIGRSGRYYIVAKQRDVKGASLEVFQRIDGLGWISCGAPVTFGPEDAKRAGLDNKETYRKWPVDMYWNRALASAFRGYCSDCCSAPAYLPDELEGSGYRTDVETGEIVAEAQYVPKMAPTTKVTVSSVSGGGSNLRQQFDDLVTETGADVQQFLKEYKAKTVDDLTEPQLVKAVNLLKIRRAAK